MSHPDSPPNLTSERPLGNFHPLFSAEPLGQKPLGRTMPQLQFMKPLGARPLTTLDPSVFCSEAQGHAAEISEPFDASPFFPEPDVSVPTPSSHPTTTFDSLATIAQRSSLNPQEQSATGGGFNVSESRTDSLVSNPAEAQVEPLDLVQPKPPERTKPEPPDSSLAMGSSSNTVDVVQRSQSAKSIDTDTLSTAPNVSSHIPASSLPAIQAKSETDTNFNALTTIDWSGGSKSSLPPSPAVPPVDRIIEPDSSLPNEAAPSRDTQEAAGWTYEKAITPDRSGPALFQQDRAQQSPVPPESNRLTPDLSKRPQQNQSPEEKISAASIDSTASSKQLKASPTDNQSFTSSEQSSSASELHSLEVIQRQIDEVEVVSKPKPLAHESITPEVLKEQRLDIPRAKLVNESSSNPPEIQANNPPNIQAKREESPPPLSTTPPPDSSLPSAPTIHDDELNTDIAKGESTDSSSAELLALPNLVQPEPESSSPLPSPNTSGGSKAIIQRSLDPTNNREASSSIDLTPSSSEPLSPVDETLESDSFSVGKSDANQEFGEPWVNHKNLQPTSSESGSESIIVAPASTVSPDLPASNLASEQSMLDSVSEGQPSVMSELQPLEVLQRQVNETEVLSEPAQFAEQDIVPEVPKEQIAQTPGPESIHEPFASSPDIQAKKEENTSPLNIDISTESVVQRSRDEVEPDIDSSVDIPHFDILRSDIPHSTEPSSVSDLQLSEEDTLPLSAELSPKSSPPSAPTTAHSEAFIQRLPKPVDEAVNSSSGPRPSPLPSPSSSLNNKGGLDSEASLVSNQSLESNLPDFVVPTSNHVPDSTMGQPKLAHSTEEQPTVISDLQPQNIVQRQTGDTQVFSQPEPSAEQLSSAEVVKELGGQEPPYDISKSGQSEPEQLNIPASTNTSDSASVSAGDIVQRSLDSADSEGGMSTDFPSATSSESETPASIETLPSTFSPQIDQGDAVIQQKPDSLSLSASETAESVTESPESRSIDDDINQFPIDNFLTEISEATDTGVDADIQQLNLSENEIQRSPESKPEEVDLTQAAPTQWSSIADLLAQSTENDPASSSNSASSQRSPAEPPAPAYPDLHPYEPPPPIQASPAPVSDGPFPPVIQRDAAPTSESTAALAETEPLPAEAESSEEAEATDSEAALEDLAQTIYQMMQQRLMIERERLGRYYSSGFR